tara:strand:+ start:22125 stop:22379 length:255 start_codon:yes stop_codon:yes gene_type:complete
MKEPEPEPFTLAELQGNKEKLQQLGFELRPLEGYGVYLTYRDTHQHLWKCWLSNEEGTRSCWWDELIPFMQKLLNNLVQEIRKV